MKIIYCIIITLFTFNTFAQPLNTKAIKVKSVYINNTSNYIFLLFLEITILYLKKIMTKKIKEMDISFEWFNTRASNWALNTIMIIIQKKKYMIQILNSTWIILSYLHHCYCDCHYDCRQHIDSPQRDLLFRWRIRDGRGIHSSHTKTSKCTAHSYIYMFPKLSNFNIFFVH